MKTKDRVLKLLKENTGKYLSGQSIADTIFVTRASVWKAIKSLESEGYEIDAVTNKGYRLRRACDLVDSDFIREQLLAYGIDMPVVYYDEIDSTNEAAIRYARENRGNAVFIADTQTNGRGRRGRSFYSPKTTGLYMSILIHPDCRIKRMTDITAMAACAVAGSIDELIFDGRDVTKIKWVNDIFINDKKVSGILTEAFTSLEDEENSYIVIGIGVNIFAPKEDFPKELREIAGTVTEGLIYESGTIRNELTISIVKKLFNYCQNSSENNCLTLYRQKSLLDGNYVKINKFTGDYDYAYVTGIGDDYHLHVRYENGKEGELSSGEVSVVKY